MGDGPCDNPIIVEFLPPTVRNHSNSIRLIKGVDNMKYSFGCNKSRVKNCNSMFTKTKTIRVQSR